MLHRCEEANSLQLPLQLFHCCHRLFLSFLPSFLWCCLRGKKEVYILVSNQFSHACSLIFSLDFPCYHGSVSALFRNPFASFPRRLCKYVRYMYRYVSTFSLLISLLCLTKPYYNIQYMMSLLLATVLSAQVSTMLNLDYTKKVDMNMIYVYILWGVKISVSNNMEIIPIFLFHIKP